MPRYRFEYVAEPTADPIYVDLPDVSTAHREARHALANVIMDNIESRKTLAIDVYNDAGERLLRVKKEEGL